MKITLMTVMDLPCIGLLLLLFFVCTLKPQQQRLLTFEMFRESTQKKYIILGSTFIIRLILN